MNWIPTWIQANMHQKNVLHTTVPQFQHKMRSSMTAHRQSPSQDRGIGIEVVLVSIAIWRLSLHKPHVILQLHIIVNFSFYMQKVRHCQFYDTVPCCAVPFGTINVWFGSEILWRRRKATGFWRIRKCVALSVMSNVMITLWYWFATLTIIGFAVPKQVYISHCCYTKIYVDHAPLLRSRKVNNIRSWVNNTRPNVK